MKFSKKLSKSEIAYELNIHHQTVLNHSQKTGFKKKLDVWMTHELSVKNEMHRDTHIFDEWPKIKKARLGSFVASTQKKFVA